eukprot:9482879-Pyramimonas_sp.AAC.1
MSSIGGTAELVYSQLSEAQTRRSQDKMEGPAAEEALNEVKAEVRRPREGVRGGAGGVGRKKGSGQLSHADNRLIDSLPFDRRVTVHHPRFARVSRVMRSTVCANCTNPHRWAHVSGFGGGCRAR